MDLVFQNPEFREGMILTVRRGIKWDLMKGKHVIVREAGTAKKLGTARIYDTKVIAAHMILEKEDSLHLEHNPECRTKDGLFDEMERIYPGWRPCEIVTLVYFDIL